jgi:hypothetical protein
MARFICKKIDDFFRELDVAKQVSKILTCRCDGARESKKMFALGKCGSAAKQDWAAETNRNIAP